MQIQKRVLKKKVHSLFLAIILGGMLLLSGCDLSLLEELLPNTGLTSTEVLQGTLNVAETFTVGGSSDTFTIEDLQAGERAIVAVSPWDTSTMAALNYDVKISISGVGMQSQKNKTANPTGVSESLQRRIIFPEHELSSKEPRLPALNGSSEDYYTYEGQADALINSGEQTTSGLKHTDNINNSTIQENSAAPMSTDTREFYVRDSGSYKTITASRVKTGTRLYIYLDDAVAGRVTDAQILKLTQEFDGKIYSTVTGNFGTPEDVDYNNKTILLISPMTYKGSSTQLVGYFDESDFYSNSSSNRYSNEADMIYLNASVVVKGDMPTLYGNMAHEFQHLVFFSEKCRAEGRNSNGDRFDLDYSDVWINEGFSMLAAHLTGYSSIASDWRVYDRYNGYFARPEQDGLLSWETNRDASNYGSAGLFAYYLYEHNRSVIKKITQATSTIEHTISVEVGGEGLAGVFRNWMVANAADRLKNVSDSKYRYNNITLFSSPTIQRVTDSDSTDIRGMGVCYWVISGSNSDVRITLSDYFDGQVPDSNVAVLILGQ